MPSTALEPVSMDQLDSPAVQAVEWVWHGYLARGNITLLTSVWKAGKTTLITGLLRALAAGGQFLELPCVAGRATVISEESREHWAARVRQSPIGSHARLLARPFLTRPTEREWDDLIEVQRGRAGRGELDLLVVDPLAAFLPGRTESDAGTLLRFLEPLQRLASAGVAVLVLHHPRKQASPEGSTARGSGALLGYVDVILELTRAGSLAGDENRRRLTGLSRHGQTPPLLHYLWNADASTFTVCADLMTQRFEDNWEKIRGLLAVRTVAATHNELLQDWPTGPDKPSATQLYLWLNHAWATKRVRREGQGRKRDPYRYRLENEDDQYRDRGELPPLKDLDFLMR
ncbi:MAG: AAA family ATPase [Gemmataceae bacterium]|nr:AAA family ATPase [Gemmataceae bacterium]